jgi:hypothetical protein
VFCLGTPLRVCLGSVGQLYASPCNLMFSARLINGAMRS